MLSLVVRRGGKDLPLGSLMTKRITHVWELMFTRAIFGGDMERQRFILNTGARLIDLGLLQLPAVKVTYSLCMWME